MKINIEFALKDVSNKLKDNKYRLDHTIRVYEVSLILADKYNIDKEEVGVMSLYHDYFKNSSFEVMEPFLTKKEVKKYFKVQDNYHALAAANYLKSIDNTISDDIINAIRGHMILNNKLTIYDKILYISDFAEAGRTFLNPKELLEIALDDIDKGLLYALEVALKFLKDSNIEPHKRQIKIYKKLKRGKIIDQ